MNNVCGMPHIRVNMMGKAAAAALRNPIKKTLEESGDFVQRGEPCRFGQALQNADSLPNVRGKPCGYRCGVSDCDLCGRQSPLIILDNLRQLIQVARNAWKRVALHRTWCSRKDELLFPKGRISVPEKTNVRIRLVCPSQSDQESRVCRRSTR